MVVELSALERDAVTEILNIGVGRAAASLSLMVRDEIQLSVPSAELLYGEAARLRLSLTADRMVAVREAFRGLLSGSAALLFPQSKSLDLVRMVLDEDLTAEEVTELEQEALVEIGNVILNGCLSSIADALVGEIETSIPVLLHADLATILPQAAGCEPVLLVLTIDFTIRSRDIQGHIVFLMDMQAAGIFQRLIADYITSIA
ncbi:chemotaxis protein CheC [Aliidongia dinghuensis]|uniref:Chemotaxis protein CheC n=1 Tax=Aliidongia dinghuensis TaxID=1867774 RepID=A0A8J2YSH2_9PROT|nr:chemotaxis protein CheX [Aliidongia dinghuensis]GGF15810.1 chemotaxis protein CheC [Aliidongia dinghuensis]